MPTKQKGYKLADGSYSSEYKTGDKFVVTNTGGSFKKGSIVSFFEDDLSYAPLFQLEQGYTEHKNANGNYGAYTGWERLKPYKPTPEVSPQVAQKEFTKAAFVKASLKDGMVVTTRNGDAYTVTGDRLLRDGGGFLCLEDFDDGLLCSAKYGNEEFDIISVQQTITLFKRETEAELKQQRIAKELEFAEAKREQLDAHIEKLKRNLQA